VDSFQKATLIDLLLRSDKRRKILLFLKDGSKSIQEITGLLDSSCTAVLPQIKRLTEKGLIEQENKNYRLSTIGLIVTEKMVPLLGTLEVFEGNLEYWAQKDLTGIPPFLRLKLGMLSRYKVIEPPLNRMFEPPEEFISSLQKSKEIMYFSSFFQPSFSGFDQDFLKKKTASTFIFTKSLFERVLNPHSEEAKDLLLPKNSSVYLYEGVSSIVSLTVTEMFMALLLLNNKGKFDRSLLISFESKAIEWGKELFMYYREESVKIYREELSSMSSGGSLDIEKSLNCEKSSV
jgi:predicted transcriptional regulator